MEPFTLLVRSMEQEPTMGLSSPPMRVSMTFRLSIGMKRGLIGICTGTRTTVIKFGSDPDGVLLLLVRATQFALPASPQSNSRYGFLIGCHP